MYTRTTPLCNSLAEESPERNQGFRQCHELGQAHFKPDRQFQHVGNSGMGHCRRVGSVVDVASFFNVALLPRPSAYLEWPRGVRTLRVHVAVKHPPASRWPPPFGCFYSTPLSGLPSHPAPWLEAAGLVSIGWAQWAECTTGIGYAVNGRPNDRSPRRESACDRHR